MKTQTEVTETEFFGTVGKTDAVLSIVPGLYPYTTIFRLRHGEEVGRIVDTHPAGQHWPITHKYYSSI